MSMALWTDGQTFCSEVLEVVRRHGNGLLEVRLTDGLQVPILEEQYEVLTEAEVEELLESGLPKTDEDLTEGHRAVAFAQAEVRAWRSDLAQ